MRQFILVACLAIVSVSAKPGPGYSYNIPASGGLAANLLPPSTNVNQQFAPSHGSLGLSHNSNGASLALGTSYSAASPVANSHHSFNGHSHGGLLASYGSPIQHAAGPSFTPTIAIVPPPPSQSYGAPLNAQLPVAPPAPSQSYGAPLSSSFSVVQPAPSQSYGAPPSPSFSVVAPASSSHSSYVAPASGPVSSFSGPVQSSGFSGSSFGSAPSSSFNSFSSVAPSAGAEQTIVQKHIYVHVPPPDVEEQQIINQAPQPVSHQKHYKIIFIKAPSPPSIQEQLLKQQIAQQPINEEKTLVYVLVKKPEGLQELRQAQAAQAIQAAQTVQNKPEVYFIKYKAEKGASPSLSSLAANLPLVGSSSISSGNVDLSGLSSGASFLGGSELSSASSLSASSVISGSSGHTGGKTYLPPVENPPPSAISSGEGSSLSSSSLSQIIQPRTPAPEYGPPKQH